MKFYVGNTLQPIEIAPQITETFDETLDTAQVVLKANSISNPYAPMQPCYFDFETTPSQFLYMYIVSDQVELYSTNPITYKHTLTLIQKSRRLSKMLVRDSVFTQPITDKKFGYTAVSYVREDDITSSFRQLQTPGGVQISGWQEPLKIYSKDKIVKNKLYFKLTTYYIEKQIGNIQTSNSLSDILEDVEQGATLKIYNNGTFIRDYEIEEGNYTTWNEIDITSLAGEDSSICFEFYDEWVTKTDGNILRVIFHIDYYVETYYYTCYDILKLLMDRYEENCDDIFGRTLHFSLPSSGDLYDLLKNTKAPNFTFTGMTMYECVAEVFKLFDAIFTLSPSSASNILDIEYFNEYTGEVDSNMKFSSFSSKMGEDKHNNKLVNYFQDGRTIDTFPSGKAFAGLRTNELGVPSQSAYNILLPHPINQLLKIKIKMPTIWLGYIEEITGQSIAHKEEYIMPNAELDITPFVLEHNLWSLLNSTGRVPYNDNNFLVKLQNATTSYTKNSNYINFSGFYTTPTSLTQSNIENLLSYAVKRWSGYAYKESVYPALPQDNEWFGLEFGGQYGNRWQNLKFKVEYITSLNGKVQIDSITHKFNGEMLIGQQSGAVDLFKLGLNMQGLSLKLGEPTLTMTHQITNWDNRIKKGQYIIKDGERWIANVCQYTLFNDKMIGTIEFAKNYNALSQRIKLNQEKRLSLIDSSLVQKSEILLMEYLYASSSYDATLVRSALGEKMFFDNGYIKYGMGRTFTDGIYTIWKHTIDYATIDVFDSDDNYYRYTDDIGASCQTRDIYIPLSKYACGNTLCFEVSFNDTKSAGNKLRVATGWFSSSYFSSYIPYTDDNGFADKITIKMKCNDYATDFSNLPDLYNSGTLSDDNFIIIPKLEVWKQPNEIIALNYQLAILPIPERKDIDIIGSKMIEENSLLKGRDSTAPTFYFHYSTTETYDILDTKGVGTRKLVESIGISPEGTSPTCNYFRASFTHNANLSDLTAIKSWAICDSQGNIYFASNSQPTNKDIAYIHFYPHHVKLS